MEMGTTVGFYLTSSRIALNYIILPIIGYVRSLVINLVVCKDGSGMYTYFANCINRSINCQIELIAVDNSFNIKF